jgi:hypothetical protein
VEGRRDRPKQTFGGSDVFHSVPFTGVVLVPYSRLDDQTKVRPATDS